MLKEIMFEDDTITADKKRCADICNKILDRKLNICWSANVRADLDDFDLMKLMKKSGCRMLVVGFEYGNQQVLDNVRKRVTVEQMKQFAKLTKQAGIMVHGCFMIGGMGETRESAEDTMRLAKELQPDTLQFSATTPYPGTSFYEWCQKNKYIMAQDWPEWIDKQGEQTAIIDYPELHQKEIIDLVDKGLYNGFYFKPKTWYYHLRTIKSFSDLKRKARGAIGLLSYWQSKNQGLRRFIRFAIIGGTAGALSLLTLWIQVSKLGVNYLIANAISFILSIMVGYLGNWLWTFKERGKYLFHKYLSFPMYILLCSINLLVVLGICYLFVHIVKINYILASLIAGVVLVPTNFLISKTWIFKKAIA